MEGYGYFRTVEGTTRLTTFEQGEPIEGAPVDGFADLGRRHFRNFINCVRSRNRDELNGEILEGHRSSLLAHLGNISYRLGKNVPGPC